MHEGREVDFGCETLSSEVNRDTGGYYRSQSEWRAQIADIWPPRCVSKAAKFCPFCCPCRSPTWSPRRSTFGSPMHHPVAYPTHPVHPGPRGTDVRFASGLVAVVLGCVSVVIPLSSLSSQSGSGSWFLGVPRRIVCSQSTSRSKSGSLSVVLGHTPQNQSQDKDKDKDTRAGTWGGE